MKIQEKSRNSLGGQAGWRSPGGCVEGDHGAHGPAGGRRCVLILAALILYLMPGQVPVSEADVVNGRQFPAMLMADDRLLRPAVNPEPDQAGEEGAASHRTINLLTRSGPDHPWHPDRGLSDLQVDRSVCGGRSVLRRGVSGLFPL